MLPKTPRGTRRMSVVDYNQRISFLASGSLDNLGNIAAPAIFCTVWANLKAVISVRGAAILKGDQILSKTNYEIAMRYRDDIDESMAVQFRGQTFTIDNIADPTGERIELRMIASLVDERI